VLSVLKFWLTRHFEDFANDPQLTTEMQRFIESQMLASMKIPATQLLKTLEKRVRENLFLAFLNIE
jgi:hypothetical protein